MARKKPNRAPAKTLEAREMQLVDAAVSLAEKQLLEGTASATVITHYLKLGTSTFAMEKQKLEEENKLLRAKTKALEEAGNTDEKYEAVLRALQGYRQTEEPLDEDPIVF